MARLLVVRHGQASYGADDYDRLSALGEEQAALLGRWFAQTGVRPARVASGALRRQRATAEHCMAVLGDSPPPAAWIADPAFDEYDAEHIMHVHRPDLDSPAAMRAHLDTTEDPVRRSRELFFEAMDRWTASGAAGAYRESWPAFHGRCMAAFERVAAGLGDDETALVFTSGGVISALCHRLLGMPPRAAFELNWTLANTGISAVTARKGRLRLLSLNGTPHFEQAGQTDRITYR